MTERAKKAGHHAQLDVAGTVGPYLLLERLGAGGMGEVWRARLLAQRGAEVALKILLPASNQNPGHLELFRQEARLCLRLNHPNIVRLHDAGTDGELRWIAMELVRGLSLLELMVRFSKLGSRLPIEYVLHIAASLGEALQHAHEATDDAGRTLGIVHLDVSPANVLLGHGGMVKLTDFGMAHSAILEGAGREVQHARGKLGYMAPEQLAGQTITPRTDQFALGTVLYELCTLRRLWRTRSAQDTAQRIMSGDLAARLAQTEIPDALKAVILKACAPDPADRYDSCGTVAAAIRGLIDKSGVTLEPKRLWQEVQDHCRKLEHLDTGDIVLPEHGSSGLPSLSRKLNRKHPGASRALGTPDAERDLHFGAWIRASVDLARNHRTGLLRADRAGQLVDVFFWKGHICAVEGPGMDEALLGRLVGDGRLSAKQAWRVLKTAGEAGRPAERVLLGTGRFDQAVLMPYRNQLYTRTWGGVMWWGGGRMRWFGGLEPRAAAPRSALDVLPLLRKYLGMTLSLEQLEEAARRVFGRHATFQKARETPFPITELAFGPPEHAIMAYLDGRPRAMRVLRRVHLDGGGDASLLLRTLLVCVGTGHVTLVRK